MKFVPNIHVSLWLEYNDFDGLLTFLQQNQQVKLLTYPVKYLNIIVTMKCRGIDASQRNNNNFKSLIVI